MVKLPPKDTASPAVAISIAAHAVVIALALAYVPAERDKPAVRPAMAVEILEVTKPAVITPVVIDEPVDFALLDDSQMAAVASTAIEPPVTSTSPTRRAPPAISASTRSAATETQGTIVPGTTEPAVIPGPRNPLMDMRRKRPDLRLQPNTHDNLDHVPAGSTPEIAAADTGQLAPSGGGTYRSNQGVFSVNVGKDGSVKLKDAKNFHISLPDPRKIPKIPKMIGKGIASWYGQESKTPGDPDREPINNKRPADADTRPDHGQTASVPIASGGFDVSDFFMRRHGQDPYAAKKLKYLDSTRDERVQIGNRYKAQQLEQSTQLMQKNIDSLWSHTLDPAARKQGLFELWDDCAEAGDPTIVEGGRAARLLVVGVIRARFPAASEQAFTATELAALNRKRSSKATFAPY